MKKLLKVFILSFMFLFFVLSFNRETYATKYVTGVQKVSTNQDFSYVIYRPYGSENKDNLPIIFYLSGMMEVNNLDALYNLPLFEQLKDGSYAPECIIVAPCLPSGNWNNCTKSIKSFMDSIVSYQNVDKSRIYLTSVSLGTNGAGKLVYEYPNYFAAFAPVAGLFINKSGVDAKVLGETYGNFNIPVLLLIDDLYNGRGYIDTNYDLDTFESAIINAGGTFIKKNTGCSHDNIQEKAYSPSDYALIEWLLSQKNNKIYKIKIKKL